MGNSPAFADLRFLACTWWLIGSRLLACTSQRGTKSCFAASPWHQKTGLACVPQKSPWHRTALRKRSCACRVAEFDVGLDQNSDGRCHEVEVLDTRSYCTCQHRHNNNTHTRTTPGCQITLMSQCYLNQPIRENSVKFLSCRPSHKPAPGECGQQASRSFEVRPKQDKTSGPAVKRESSTPGRSWPKRGSRAVSWAQEEYEGYSTGSKP